MKWNFYLVIIQGAAVIYWLLFKLPGYSAKSDNAFVVGQWFPPPHALCIQLERKWNARLWLGWKDVEGLGKLIRASYTNFNAKRLKNKKNGLK